MYCDRELNNMINRMFVPPQDYDAIQVQTRETPDEPILIITLFRNSQVIFYQNYEVESTRLDEGREGSLE